MRRSAEERLMFYPTRCCITNWNSTTIGNTPYQWYTKGDIKIFIVEVQVIRKGSMYEL